MRDKKKVNYLIHVAWRHIFQRPHILFLKLEKDYDCLLVEKVHYKNYSMPKQTLNPKRKLSIFQLPKTGEIKLLRKICDFYNRLIIKHYMDCDLVWICHPEQYKDIPKTYKGKIVYDCMDNYASLGDTESKKLAIALEKKLINRADLIFASSQKLVEMINEPQKTVLVRNGFMTEDNPLPVKGTDIKEHYTIAYFGSVSTWFDFELLKKNVQETKKVDYRIIGPASNDIIGKNKHDQIVFTGPVPHKDLVTFVEDCDALIMPFIVNDIILAVDPVKMYEYINFGKCVISVWYPEIDRFDSFVYFYHNHEEYSQLIKELAEKGFPPKYNEKQRNDFLQANSWDTRYEIIRNEIEKLIN